MSGLRLLDATGTRHSVVAAPVAIPVSAADPPGVHHASVARDGRPEVSAGGGAARTAEGAAAAAIAEAVERLAASHTTVPIRRASGVPADAATRLAGCSLHSDLQRAQPGFPYRHAYPDDEWLAETFDLPTNRPHWVPAALVSLTDVHGALATSSGLAADPSVETALLRALQELIERDAFVVTWLHGLGGREIATDLPAGFRAFDLTPAYSPHPVAAVVSSAPAAGVARHSLGLACRARWRDAVDKAFLECCQGNVFVGVQLARGVRPVEPHDVRSFEDHAVFYATHPERWAEVPLLRRAVHAGAPADAADGSLAALVRSLAAHGVAASYRELTTVDANQIGLRVVRVVAPALTPLHHDHRWPFLGGRTADVAWRYPGAVSGDFPSPFPHALG